MTFINVYFSVSLLFYLWGVTINHDSFAWPRMVRFFLWSKLVSGSFDGNGSNWIANHGFKRSDCSLMMRHDWEPEKSENIIPVIIEGYGLILIGFHLGINYLAIGLVRKILGTCICCWSFLSFLRWLASQYLLPFFGAVDTEGTVPFYVCSEWRHWEKTHCSGAELQTVGTNPSLGDDHRFKTKAASHLHIWSHSTSIDIHRHQSINIHRHP